MEDQVPLDKDAARVVYGSGATEKLSRICFKYSGIKRVVSDFDNASLAIRQHLYESWRRFKDMTLSYGFLLESRNFGKNLQEI